MGRKCALKEGCGQNLLKTSGGKLPWTLGSIDSFTLALSVQSELIDVLFYAVQLLIFRIEG